MNEIECIDPTEVWESGFDIFGWTSSVPEVVGEGGKLKKASSLPVQLEFTPPPKCLEKGYTYVEWCRHWKKALEYTIMNAPEEERQEGIRMLKEREQKRRGKAKICRLLRQIFVR